MRVTHGRRQDAPLQIPKDVAKRAVKRSIILRADEP